MFPILINKDVFEPSYNDLKFTVWNCNYFFTAAAKALQSCPTLCDPIDGSPSGSPAPGILGKNTGVGCHFLLQSMKVKSESEVTQSCPTLSNPMDCSLPSSSIHGIFQARVLEWVANSFSRRSSQPKGQTWVSCVAGRFFTVWTTRGAHLLKIHL